MRQLGVGGTFDEDMVSNECGKCKIGQWLENTVCNRPRKGSSCFNAFHTDVCQKRGEGELVKD